MFKTRQCQCYFNAHVPECYMPILRSQPWQQKGWEYFRRSLYKERFHSRGQHLCKFTGTKESVCIRKVKFNSHGFVWNTKKAALSLFLMSCENALHWSYKNVPDHIHGNWLNLPLYIADKVLRNDVSDILPVDNPVCVFWFFFFLQKAVDGHPSDLTPTFLQVPFFVSLGGLSWPLWISGPTVLIYWKKHNSWF